VNDRTSAAMTAASLTGLLAFVLFVLAGVVFWGHALAVAGAVAGLAMVGATGTLICRATR
jgi:thiamine transporter ThiT